MKKQFLWARLEDEKICDACRKTIVGEYDEIRTRRRTMLYFHKNMRCIKKSSGKEVNR